jgi:glutathione S-transferase
MMDLYFSPMACSVASRIALYEAGARDVGFIEVDPKTKRTLDGTNTDYRKIYPLGLVPLLRLDDGTLLSENAAILQYIAGRYPAAKLAPADETGRARLQQWLCFIGTELHKGLFIPLFDQKAPDGTRAHTLQKSKSRLQYQRSSGRPRIFARQLLRGGRLSLYHPELDGADAGRSHQLADSQALPRILASETERRQSIP